MSGNYLHYTWILLIKLTSCTQLSIIHVESDLRHPQGSIISPSLSMIKCYHWILSVIILITARENAFTSGHALTWIDWFLCYCCKNLKVTWEWFLASVTNLLDYFSNEVTRSVIFLFFWIGFGLFSVQNSRWSCPHHSSHFCFSCFLYSNLS